MPRAIAKNTARRAAKPSIVKPEQASPQSIIGMLLGMEDPVFDTVSLLRAAIMAATDISDTDQRAAMKTLLWSAADRAKEAQDGWNAALEVAARESKKPATQPTV
jgi:hypothetical protein